MNNMQGPSVAHLVIIPPTGAILNEDMILHSVRTQTGIDAVQLIKHYPAPEVRSDRTLILWIHKDAPKKLPGNILELMMRYSSAKLIFTCPVCKKDSQPTSFDHVTLRPHRRCKHCNEQRLF